MILYLALTPIPKIENKLKRKMKMRKKIK